MSTIYSVSYASLAQMIAESDIETKKLDGLDGVCNYIEKRLDIAFMGVYVCSFSEIEGYNSEYSPAALITRSFNELYKYIQNFWLMNTPAHISIFEYETYGEAIDFLRDHFETSPYA